MTCPEIEAVKQAKAAYRVAEEETAAKLKEQEAQFLRNEAKGCPYYQYFPEWPLPQADVCKHEMNCTRDVRIDKAICNVAYCPL
jgi:hypothetical protein